MKDTKHIRRDFHSVPLVMPQGWDFGALGAQGVKEKNFKHGHVVYCKVVVDSNLQVRVVF